MKEETIIRLILGELSPEEKEETLAWIANSPENRDEYYRLKNLWALVSHNSVTHTAEKEDVQKFLGNVRTSKMNQLRKRLFVFSRYAAVILIAFFIGKLVFQKPGEAQEPLAFNEVVVPSGQMAQLTLSDGSVVFINSCSKLRYPAKFKTGERKVFLSGEAYFAVVKNIHAPFIVETNKRAVKVLGTTFNVMAYPDDKYYLTTLIEGKVILLDSTGSEMAQLKPGEQFLFDNSKESYTVKVVQTDLFTSWKDGLYQFDHETLKGLTEYLERIFAVEIHIEDPEIENYKFTGTISRNVSFEQILKIIQISSPIKYKLKENHGAITEATLFSLKEKKGGNKQ